MVRAADDAGINLYIFVEDVSGTSVTHRLNESIFEYCNKHGSCRLFSLPSSLRNRFDEHYPQLLEFVERNHIDLIHTEHLRGGINLIDIKQQFDIPILNSYRGSEIAKVKSEFGSRGSRLLKPGYEAFLWNVLPAIDLHLPVSRYLADYLDEFDVDPGKVRVVHNGVDLHEFSFVEKSVSQVAEDGPIRLLAYKRTVSSIQAIKSVASALPHLECVFIGDEGPADENTIINSLNLQSIISCLGRVSVDNSADFLRRCDVVLHPTWYDGCSNFVLEAMAVGRPVIGTNGFGVDEQVVHGETGLLVDHANSRQIADAIIFLATDEVKRRKLGLAGRNRVENYFSSARKTRSYLKAYKELSG